MELIIDILVLGLGISTLFILLLIHFVHDEMDQQERR
jgi:hypothetical protein